MFNEYFMTAVSREGGSNKYSSEDHFKFVRAKTRFVLKNTNKLI